jgi:hypothetical protein
MSKPTPPVDIRHGQRTAHDAGQEGDVCHLLESTVTPGRLDELLVGEDGAGHPHPGPVADRDLPLEI